MASRPGGDGRDQSPPHTRPRFEFFSGLTRAALARAVTRRTGLLPAPGVRPATRHTVAGAAGDRRRYSFFASLSSLLISRRVVSPFTVSIGLSFSKVLRPIPLMRTTCIGSANGLAVR